MKTTGCILVALLTFLMVFVVARLLYGWYHWRRGDSGSLKSMYAFINTLVETGYDGAKLCLASREDPYRCVELTKSAFRKQEHVRLLVRLAPDNAAEYERLQSLLAAEKISHESQSKRNCNRVVIDCENETEPIERVCRLLLEQFWGLSPESPARCGWLGSFRYPRISGGAKG